MATINTQILTKKKSNDDPFAVDDLPWVETTSAVAPKVLESKVATIDDEFLSDAIDGVFEDIVYEDVEDDEPATEQVVEPVADKIDASEPTKELYDFHDAVVMAAAVAASMSIAIAAPEGTEPTQPEVVTAGVDVAQSAISIVVEPAAEPEPVWDKEFEAKKDEAAFFRELKRLNQDIANKEEILNEAKEEAKAAKAEFNLATARLQSFVSKGVQYRKKPEPKKPEPKTEPKKEQPATPTTEPTAADKPISETVDWRKIPTLDIAQGIDGLGKKKLESIVDLFPTLGHLMDVRTEASKDFKPFHTLLPKGVGEAIGTELINRMDAKIVPGM